MFAKPVTCLLGLVMLALSVSAADEVAKPPCKWPVAGTTIQTSKVQAYAHPSDKNTVNDCPGTRRQCNPRQVPTNKVFFIAPGEGACSRYKDSSMTACICDRYALPKSDGSREDNFPCDTWIEVEYQGRKVQARVQDKCPGADCDGVYLSRRAFGLLGGHEAVEAGSIQGDISWRVLDAEPWWGCLAGLPGRTSAGQVDTCEKNDDYGCPRNGRKTGYDRVIGPKVYQAPYCPAYEPKPKVQSKTATKTETSDARSKKGDKEGTTTTNAGAKTRAKKAPDSN